MRKLLVLPLFAGVVALSSCSAFSISVDGAKDILQNILNVATTNGKYIGGKYLTRHSTLSNITYDLETAIVEEHRTDNYYYFDLENNYFRLDSISLDKITEYTGVENEKRVEIDYYLYVLNGYIYNTVVTTVNKVESDKTVVRTAVSVDSMKAFQATVDSYYADFISVFETAVVLTEEVLNQPEQDINAIDATLSSFSPSSLSVLTKDLVENLNIYIDFRYSLLNAFEVFNRDTHELYTEDLSYRSFDLNFER